MNKFHRFFPHLLDCFLWMSLVAFCFAQDSSNSSTIPLTPVAPAQKDYFIGHRYYNADECGWGWIKKPNEPWSAARWTALKESPFSGSPQTVAPSRSLGSKGADHNFEYKLYGRYADYMAYDPHQNELLPVFIIEGYESLGLAKPLKRNPGPSGRVTPPKKKSNPAPAQNTPVTQPAKVQGADSAAF